LNQRILVAEWLPREPPGRSPETVFRPPGCRMFITSATTRWLSGLLIE
jgi:hypothetical protein